MTTAPTVDVTGLRLLASAFAGRPVEVVDAGPGVAAWTDGSTVHLDATAAPTDQVQMLAVQGSLLAGGSLDPTLVRPLQHRPALARRYLAVEGHRALAANASVLPSSVLHLLDRDLIVALDDPAASLALAGQRHAAVPAPPAAFGTLRPRAVLAVLDRIERATAVQNGPAALGTRPADELVELDDEPDDDGNLGHLLTSPVGGGGPFGRMLKRLLSPARHRDGGGPPGADTPTHRASARRGAGRRVVLADAPAATRGDAEGAVRAGSTYPEWDVHHRRYREDWCTVTEAEVDADGAEGQPLVGADALRRPLARLGIGLTPCRRQRQGDDIDIDATVEARVDALAGRPHDDGVYIDSLRRRRDLAVLLLLDVSGSAAEPGTAGQPVHEHQRSAAAALTGALHDLGDRVALYGFSSSGRQAVRLLRVKTFDDRLDEGVAERLAALRPGAYTRLGAAIRHGARTLDERGGTPRRLLIVLSDGFAYDHGYEGAYGQADARRALVEARRLGIGCLCLSIGADADPDALRRVFGPAAHATVPRVEQLSVVIGPLFQGALRTAESQRRVHQRTNRTRERLLIERDTA